MCSFNLPELASSESDSHWQSPSRHDFRWPNLKRTRKLLGKDEKGYIYIKYSKRGIVQEKQSPVLNGWQGLILNFPNGRTRRNFSI